MKIRFKTVCCIVVLFLSCKNEKSESRRNIQQMLTEISKMKEYQEEERRVDSINKTSGITLRISIQIPETSTYKDDSAKNIGRAYITEGVSYESKIIYIVRFDQKTKKVISIEKNSR